MIIVISVEKFALTKDVDITISIKPRSVDGILMAMQSTKKINLLLEMRNGTISFTVDVGKGPMSTSFTLPSPYIFCDGQWHSIRGL